MKITVIGACNIDITTRINNDIKLYDSNLSKISMSFGGVGRNIANNLSFLNQEVTMLTAISTDNYGEMVKVHCKDVKIDLSHALITDKYSQSIYLCINDKNGDLVIGANDMDIINTISIDYIKDNIDVINNSDCLVFDTNLTEETICYIATQIDKDKFVDTVSITKAVKLANVLKNNIVNIYALKTNKLECEVLTGKQIESDEDFILAASYLHSRGIKNVCISLGSKGVFYSSNSESFFKPTKATKIVSSNGAGDSFLAGMIYAYSKNANPCDIVKYGLSASKITCESNSAVSKDMNEENLNKEFNN